MNKKELIDFLNQQMRLPKEKREFVFDASSTAPTPFFDAIEEFSQVVFEDLDKEIETIKNSKQYYYENKDITLSNENKNITSSSLLNPFLSQVIIQNKSITICDNKKYKATKISIETYNDFEILFNEIEAIGEAA